MNATRCVFLALIVLLGAVSLHAQRPATNEVLTNDSIVRLVAGKVDASVILARIRTTRNHYDLTPETLVRLYRRGVSAPLLTAMLQASEMPKDTLTNDSVVYMLESKLPQALIADKIRASNTAFDLTPAGLAALNQSRVPSALLNLMTSGGTAASKAGVTVAPAAVSPVAAPATIVPPSAVVPATVSPATTSPSSVSPAATAGGGPAAAPAIASPVTVAPATAEPTTVTTPALASPTGMATMSAPRQVADGEAAVFRIRLSPAAAIQKIAQYFDGRKIRVREDADANGLASDWFNDRGCGLQQCANRATVRVTADGAQSVVTVLVFERTRDTAARPAAWKDSPKTRGRETAELAAALELALVK